jgi:hypothetical protein
MNLLFTCWCKSNYMNFFLTCYKGVLETLITFLKTFHIITTKFYVTENYIHFFMLIITLNKLMYWVFLKMEECVKFFQIKTKASIWRPIFMWFNRQYPSPYSKLTYIILEFDLIVNYCGFLPFNVVNFINGFVLGDIYHITYQNSLCWWAWRISLR